MKVFIARGDQGGSGFYRSQEPARAVMAKHPGIEITVDHNLPVEAVRYQDGRVKVTEVQMDIDVLVLQRPMTQQISEVARQAREQGIRVVSDIDDDFHNVHAENIAIDAVDPKLNQWHNRLWLNRALKYSNVITVSTPMLLKYAGTLGRDPYGVVVRNRIPARALKIKPQTSGIENLVGWAGTLQTHPRDMQRARGVLNEVDTPLMVIGDHTGVASALGVRQDRVVLANPWTDTVEQYWQTMADSFGIGIAPLEPSKFNRSKSSLKPQEYMALSMPFIASPTPEYRLITAQSAAGYTAASANRWAISVVHAIERREELSRHARAWAKEHTLENHAHEWYDAWCLAANSSAGLIA